MAKGTEQNMLKGSMRYLFRNYDTLFIIVLGCFFIITPVLQSLGVKNLDFTDNEKFRTYLITSLMTVLAYAILKNRSLDDKILNILNRDERHFLDEFPTSLKSEIENARSIRIVSLMLDITPVDEYDSVFSAKLSHNQTVEILLVSPNGNALTISSKRAVWEQEKSFKQRVLSQLDTLADIKFKNNKIDLKVIDFPIPYSAILIENGLIVRKRKIYIAYFPYKTKVVRQPKHILIEGEDPSFHLFEDEMNKLWDNAKNYSSSKDLNEESN
ncbi:hypothetical protein [Marinomonas mediterranea]|uniref:hypothetical protein n=1 Tax=Marinomonas mediterranea TaxID=119864 RepID=UPI002349E32E|nr:hypothetical protein [Marinomonas mediterranea]WCN09803.1 hypothetical protein GV055_13205 [Marinomonas mediterranea]WCN13885.1 hypothetical protein GV054_13215 [Marinomonas mediterranea]